MDIIYKLPLPDEICSRIFTFSCKTPHTRLGIEVLKKQLNMDFINLPSKDEYVTCIDKDKMLLFPRYPIDIYFYTIYFVFIERRNFKKLQTKL